MAASNNMTDAVVGVKATHDVAWHSMSDTKQIFKELDSSMEGLTSAEAARRLQM